MAVSIWMWVGFSLFVCLALSSDTFLLNKHYFSPHRSIRVALLWSLVWVVFALLFNIIIWIYFYTNTTIAMANEKALDFFTGYLIEKSLSIDNLFAFYVIFSQFKIPSAFQARVFSYGIWSAVVLRFVLILFGAWLVAEFHWVLYLMGAFLFLTGVKMFITQEKEKDLMETLTFRLMRRFFRVTSELKSEHFFVRINHLWYVTPLFIALIFIEISDLVFAMDSIPAIFAVTQDPFIVWTSNIFAILGLRALYFVMANMVNQFHLLKYGIALILVFVGSKMLIEPWFHIPVLIALAMIVAILIVFSYISVLHRKYRR